MDYKKYKISVIHWVRKQKSLRMNVHRSKVRFFVHVLNLAHGLDLNHFCEF